MQQVLKDFFSSGECLTIRRGMSSKRLLRKMLGIHECVLKAATYDGSFTSNKFGIVWL